MFDKRYKLYKSFSPFLLAVSLAVSLPVFALQEKSIQDNGTAKAFIANQGMTSIAVAQDRILNIRGPDGMYRIKNDNQQGAVYIQPATNNGGYPKPFTVFIATEQNHHYLLRLFPRAQPADAILLTPLDAQNPAAKNWETTSPYTQAVAELMTDMVNQTAPEGYAVSRVLKAKNQYLGKVAVLQLQQRYSGAYLQGSIYCLTNRTRQPLRLAESLFYQPGDRAISLINLVVPPLGKTFLYKVSSHG